MRSIRIYLFCIITIASFSVKSYTCFPDSAGTDIFEVNGHCLAADRSAWLTEPTYLMEFQLWGDQFGNPFPTDQVYNILVQGVEQWNNYQYNNILQPVRVELAVFHTNDPSVLMSDNASSIIFSNSAVTQFCGTGAIGGCAGYRSISTRLTNAHGGIYQRIASDLFIKDGPWSIPDLTLNCDVVGAPEIVSVISHEVGHGLGIGHKKENGAEARPVMNNYVCGSSPRFPIATDKENVDFLYGLTGGLNQTTIVEPENGTTITWLSDLINFIGVAIDPAGNDISSQIRWVSSIQGLLGVGEQINNVTLRPGSHMISADIAQSTDEPIIAELDNNSILNNSLPDLNRSIGSNTSAININVTGPIVNTFQVDDNPCFILINNNSCTSTIRWAVSGEIPPGQILIYQDGSLLSSGPNGNMTVTLLNGSNIFELKFRDSSAVDHELSSLNVQAGVINANISGPVICEIDPPPSGSCTLVISLSGFAPNIYVYNDLNELLYESNVNGFFQSDLSIAIPEQGDYIKVFYRDGNNSILLDSQSYSTFRIADHYEDDDFVKYPHPLDASFEVANIFLNQIQANHNFHKYSDIDFIRIPFPNNLGLSSLRTINLSNSISTNIEMGCVMQTPTGWRYQKLSGPTSGSESDGLQVGSSVYIWPTGTNRPECGGDAYFAKITRSDGPIGEDSSYDVIYLNALEDLYEPDDQPSDAKSLVINEIQNRNFSIDRIDYVTFTPTSGSQFNFNLSSGSSFVNPCITIYSNNSIIANDCMSGNNIDIQFDSNNDVLIKLENNTSRVATEYQISVNAVTGANDIYEDDDIPSQSVIFVNGHGTHQQSRNFFDDGIDLFQFTCYCPDVVDWIPQSSVQVNAISNGLCVVAITNPSGATLCDNSAIGTNTDYLVEHTCDCGPGYPTN